MPTATDFVELGLLKVIFLGVVQGITELLPISSTAHLRIVTSLLGWQDPGTGFSAIMQLASLGAVLAYFWRDTKVLLGSSVRAIAHQDYQSQPLRLTLGLLIGSVPMAIAWLFLKNYLNAENSPLQSLVVIGSASIFMAVFLAIAEMRGKRARDFEQITLLDGLWVGIAQAVALIPGVSRSGSMLTAGLFLNMERETAARFSFLLGLPIIIFTGAVELHTLTKASLDLNGWLILLAGLTSASISAFFAIFGLLRYLKKQSTWIFVWYRLAMGVFLLIGSSYGFLR